MRTRRAYHSRHTPDIGTGAPFGTQNHLRRPVLSGLNIISKVMVDPAGISKIRNLDTDNFESMWILGLSLLSC